MGRQLVTALAGSGIIDHDPQRSGGREQQHQTSSKSFRAMVAASRKDPRLHHREASDHQHEMRIVEKEEKSSNAPFELSGGSQAR